MSVREIRDHLGRRIDVAHVTGEPTIAERHGEPLAVIVSRAWWAEQQEQTSQGTLAPWRALPRGPSPPA